VICRAAKIKTDVPAMRFASFDGKIFTDGLSWIFLGFIIWPIFSTSKRSFTQGDNLQLCVFSISIAKKLLYLNLYFSFPLSYQ
jgi:hypothetical protein